MEKKMETCQNHCHHSVTVANKSYASLKQHQRPDSVGKEIHIAKIIQLPTNKHTNNSRVLETVLGVATLY